MQWRFNNGESHGNPDWNHYRPIIHYKQSPTKDYFNLKKKNLNMMVKGTSCQET